MRNPSCWGREHSCETNTLWETQTTAFCLAAGCRSPNSSCVSHPPGAAGRPAGQRAPGAARRPELCCLGRTTRGSAQKRNGVSSAAEPRVPPAFAGTMRGGSAGYPDPRTPRQARPARLRLAPEGLTTHLHT